ncbi:MAG: 3-dehydroquinate synthase, partial [Thermoguttaceae bacterium]|nr:3-dehydroquinate synthase [Thermoguttaceae bacterium]
TLLAQVDSSVGGKTAIDLPNAKNMVGAFHQPSGVLIDPDVMQTLPQHQYRAGLGEITKYALSLDAKFFGFLKENAAKIRNRDSQTLGTIVETCCRLKARIVEDDEFETTGRRAVLNYGHTFAHALEKSLGYGVIHHGDAVAVGSFYAAKLAKRLGEKGDERFAKIDDAFIQNQVELFELLELPTSVAVAGRKIGDSENSTPESVVKIMHSDKKTTCGKLNFVLPTALGEAVVAKGVDPTDALAVLRDGETIA